MHSSPSSHTAHDVAPSSGRSAQQIPPDAGASAAPASPAAPEPPHVEGEPVLPGSAPRRRLGHGDGHDAGPLEEHDGDARLPEATAWCIYPLITGLGLMVDADAPPVVHRVAAEILARYGQSQGRRRR